MEASQLDEASILRLHRWTIVVVICQLADIITTHMAFGMGFVEGNPIAKKIVDQSEYLMYGIKLGLIGLLLVFATKKNLWWLMAVAAMAGSYAAAANLLRIHGCGC